jgi:ABC-type multidrug transport system ATPase subunit
MSTYIGDIDNKNSTNKPFYELTYDSFIFDVSKEKRLSYNSNCIKSGSKCAIIGENGAGKTTLLKLLSGVKEEKSMNYKINNSNDIRNHLKNHSILLDSDSFLACQSVNEYLISTGAQTTKINELCTIFEIKNLLNRKGNELSGGERKRIDFVHMLLENRELVFIDEPEVFLDKKWKKIIINSIKESSKTIIYTTHDKEFIKMADMQICI